MAPNFTKSYSKNLKCKPFSASEAKIDTFHCLSSDGDLVKVTEYVLIGSEFDYYCELVAMGCGTEDFYSDHASTLKNAGLKEWQIIEELLSLDMHQPSEDSLIGRVAFNDFNFYDGGVLKTGKQIRGIEILSSYQGVGVAKQIYKCLLFKHDYLICDHIQTILGGRLWAQGMIKIGEVRVYDCTKKQFVDVLTPYGHGIKGVLPWSAVGLDQYDMALWGSKMKLSPESCRHLVNIVSKEKVYS
ncbi:hypothetical protein [Photorhabdus khanii]|uniref:Uncharacterized protein n=1 Tax=Photorhabdus khanii subsp. guanajuatensis TaxID=2100166 RepID=A0A4R4J514_9GAMM|nr:hypothetical protein [Photorhabdus khanii]TDB48221.1 hypothetical protein C5467_19295 [Photorhabdus khanii subsp. guanajuatensis]